MTSAIRFDTAVPTCREGLFVPVGFAGPEEIVATAVRADELGYHAVWATDLLIPTADYRIPDAEPPDWYDPLVSLAACAVRTERIKLGLGVVMVPFRDPVILAKQVATLDRFASGRLLLGVGLGFFRLEFEAAQPRLAKAPRGAILDERLEVLVRLLEAGEVSFEGEYANVRGVEMFPKPVQSPVPVYFPGKTPETLHRVAKWGHGLLVPLAMATDRMELLRSLLEERGRTLSEIDVVAAADVCLAASHEAAAARYLASRAGEFTMRRLDADGAVAANWVGTPDEVIEKLHSSIAAGITHFRVGNIAGDSFPAMMEQMERFATEVMPRVAG
jgi:probable F420-dependent oxidoreductase